MQPDAALRPLQERPQQPGMVIARIVETDMDHPGSPGMGVRIGPFQLLEQPQRGFGIDLLALDQGELHRFKVQCAVQVQPLAPCRGLDRRLVGTDEPAMRRPAPILGMDRSGEDNRRVRKHPARQLFIIPDEGFLRLLVGLLRPGAPAHRHWGTGSHARRFQAR